MWYRVEFNKDGSVRDAAQVSGAAEGTQTIVYVYADSKVHAIRDAALWRTRFMAAIKAERVARKGEKAARRETKNRAVALLLEVKAAFRSKPDAFAPWLDKRIEEAKKRGV